jgi:hypothetical protein
MLSHGLKYGIRSAVAAALVVGVTACGDEENGIVAPGPGPEPEPSLVQYVGSETCGGCHAQAYSDFRKSGHPFKVNRVVNGRAPTYPFSDVPSPPSGIAWSQVGWVIGGYGWKARFMDHDGFFFTSGGSNQWNLETAKWSNWEANTKVPFTCGECHNTGYKPEGNQHGVPGLVGTWALDGVQCEACHGPGSLHAADPGHRMTVDTRSEACGDCHRRGAKDGTIRAKNGFIEHRAAFHEMKAGPKSMVTCVTCHDPHLGVLYAKEKGMASPTRIACETCHKGARESLRNAPLAQPHGEMACIECHMPPAARTAVTRSKFSGDMRSHLFRIDIGMDAKQFNEAGDRSNPWLTVDYACGHCHVGYGRTWLARRADEIHGPGFRSEPAQTAGLIR